MFLAVRFGFPPLGKWVKPVMDGCVGVTGLLTDFCKGYGGPGAKAHLMLVTKALIAVGELAFAIAGARKIEVVAIADGFAEMQVFSLALWSLAFFRVISNSLQPITQPITWTTKA